MASRIAHKIHTAFSLLLRDHSLRRKQDAIWWGHPSSTTEWLLRNWSPFPVANNKLKICQQSCERAVLDKILQTQSSLQMTAALDEILTKRLSMNTWSSNTVIFNLVVSKFISTVIHYIFSWLTEKLYICIVYFLVSDAVGAFLPFLDHYQ